MQAFARLIGLMNGAGVVSTFALTFLICADIFGRTGSSRWIKMGEFQIDRTLVNN